MSIGNFKLGQAVTMLNKELKKERINPQCIDSYDLIDRVLAVLLREEPAYLNRLQWVTEQLLNRGRAVGNMKAGWLVIAFILESGGTRIEQQCIRLRFRITAQSDEA